MESEPVLADTGPDKVSGSICRAVLRRDAVSVLLGTRATLPGSHYAELTRVKRRTSAQCRMPLFQPERCRALAAECRQLALAAESKIEKTLLTNLAFSWNRLANQTDRYVEFLKTPRNEK